MKNSMVVAARRFVVGAFTLGATFALASTAPKTHSAAPGAQGKAVTEASDKFVEETEQRIQQIDQEVGALEKGQLPEPEKETLAELKKKQQVAKSQIVEVKAAPKAEKTKKVQALSETMSDVEQLLVKLDSHKLNNPSE
ncbi:MAG: hypothetical protein R3B54_00010 [Bdellovibrionota bacterium]